MLRITTVGMTAVPNSGENRVPLEDWLSECFRVKVAVPRKTLSIPILDDMRLSHSAACATNARFRVGELNSPDVSATVTYRFVFFHPFTLVGIY
jgi:hypothetical protein